MGRRDPPATRRADPVRGYECCVQPGRVDPSLAGDPSLPILLWDDILWASDLPAFEERLCPIAGRNLTRGEWDEFLPDQEYRKTCDQFPLEPDAAAGTTPG